MIFSYKNSRNIPTLPPILPQLKSKGRLLFWLDAHCGQYQTPLLQELYAIHQANIPDSVILIDDIRDCIRPAWPNLKEVVQMLKTINPQYTIILCGDIALAYPPTENITPSPVAKACIASRLYDEEITGELDDIFESELNVIGSAKGEEQAVIEGNRGVAHQYVKEVLSRNPTFKPALDLLAKI